MIRCGWCGRQTDAVDRCTSCGHVDPTRPYDQRGEPAPTVRLAPAGRPPLNPTIQRARLMEARASLGRTATDEQLAEFLDISLRTLGRWKKLAGS